MVRLLNRTNMMSIRSIFPSLAVYDTKNRCCVNTVHPRQFFCWNDGVRFTDLLGYFPRKFDFPSLFTAGINRVLFICAYPKMVWSYTSSTITRMANNLPFRYCFTMQKPTGDMGTHRPFLFDASRHFAVSALCDFSFPKPASVSLQDFFPESSAERGVKSYRKGGVLRGIFSGHNQVSFDCVQHPSRPLIVTGTVWRMTST